MNTQSMLKPDLEERSYGSGYDPLLNGVARGLERLFPPLGTVRADRPLDAPDRARADLASPAGTEPARE